MVVRFSRRKISKVLILLLICDIAAVWALLDNFGGALVAPNGGGKLVDIGRLIATIIDSEWSYSTAVFSIALALLIPGTIFFLILFARLPVLLAVSTKGMTILHGVRRRTISFASISSVKSRENKSQPFLDIYLKETQKPIVLHLGLAGAEPPEVIQEINSYLQNA